MSHGWADEENQHNQFAALRESERRLAEAQRMAGIGSWSYDVASSDIFWTDELFRIYGLTRDGRTGPTFNEYLHCVAALDRPALRAAIDVALHDGTPSTVEHHITMPSGEHRRIRSHCGGLRADNGQVSRLVGTAQDVTEQWELAERVRKSEQRYALAMEGTSDGIWLYDPQSRTLDVTPRLIELMGWRDVPTPLTVEWLVSALPETEFAALRHAIRVHRDQQAPLDVELLLPVPQRGARWFRLRGRVVVQDHGQDHLLAGTISDVTEHRALQLRLQHDAKMNALGTMAGGIAQDFNNLVTAMLGHAQLATDETRANSVAQVHLSHVMESARRSRSMVREILAFSRPDVTRRSVIDVEQLVNETVRLIQPSLPFNVGISAHGTGSSQHVLGDVAPLQRALLNVCNNSLDAVSGRGGHISVRVSRHHVQDRSSATMGLATGAYARIDVSDNGAGIEPRVLTNIFDPFFTTKPVGDRTGLGLSVVHGIVTAAGGTVSVDSKVHVGTTVTIWLPVADVAATAMKVNANPQHHCRLVVVDDDPAVGRLLQVAFTRAGYVVQLFSSPQAALDAFAANRTLCDAIITDYTMPGLNGLELVERLRHLGVEVPAVMVTGFADGALPEALARADVALVVEKPVELQALVHAVHALLAVAQPSP